MSETGFQPVNIFEKLLNHNELVYELVRHLDVEELAKLYSISRPFHAMVNSKLSTCLERNATTNAPESAAVFPWRMYRELCIYDPMRNMLDDPDTEPGSQRIRDAPSLRWLRMVMHREEAVDCIIFELAESGHQLPAGSSIVLKKLWFLMDFPDTQRRVGIVHNANIWSDHDLLLATFFLIKLDMRFTDPLDGAARLHVRRMLMAQQSLTTLLLVLERRAMTTMYDFMRMVVEWRVHMTNIGPVETVFGLPAEDTGRLMREGWTNDGEGKLLMPVDELVMKEGIRRGLGLNRWYLDMMLWGYVNPNTTENIWPPSIEKKLAEENVGIHKTTHCDRQSAQANQKRQEPGPEISETRAVSSTTDVSMQH